eukprot:comp18408_c2_seq1/m.19615 comp18408_c2_seq1/g.19615  ORF comp18408_c2_seq1/g.19615 comp18408_c2_seq1/m.19615 type:complete len:189 (-) comp18408_c2_seq1:65-631(-)
MFKDSSQAEILTSIKAPAHKHFKEGRYQDAVQGYEAGLGIAGCSTSEAAVLYSNMAECTLRLHQYPMTVMWATHAIAQCFHQSPAYVKALYRRYRAFAALGLDLEALNDLNQCVIQCPDKSDWVAELQERMTSYFGKHTVQRSTCEQCKFTHYGNMRKCGRCQRVMYCSHLCQVADWATHKSVCKSKK